MTRSADGDTTTIATGRPFGGQPFLKRLEKLPHRALCPRKPRWKKEGGQEPGMASPDCTVRRLCNIHEEDQCGADER